jgi:hypothetical protein
MLRSGPLTQRRTRAGPAQRMANAWTAVITTAWLAPLLAFAVLHAATPPPSRRLVAMTALLLAGLLAAMRLPGRYFASRGWERGGRVYRRVGVHRFGAIVPGGRVVRRFAGDGAAPWLDAALLRSLEQGTRDSEQTHWWWLFTTLAVVLWAWSIGSRWTALLLLVLSVPLNVYPILLQRYIRARLTRIMRTRRSGAALQRPKEG